MRKSDLTRGELEIKVPVFAVNEKGELMTNANGIFNAKFANLVGSSDCGDCVMVNGQANINVKINPSVYDMKKTNAETLEFKQLTLWGNNRLNANGEPECLTNASDGTPQITGMYLYGCSTIDTVYKAPEGTEFIPESSYPDLENAVQFAPNGRIFVFDDAVEIRQFRQLLKGTIVIMYDLIKALPTIGSWVQFFEYLNTCLEKNPQEKCNTAGLFLSLVDAVSRGRGKLGQKLNSGAKQAATDIQPFYFKSNATKGAFKGLSTLPDLSKRGAGTLSTYLDDVAAKMIKQGTRDPNLILERLETLIGGMSETLLKCGLKCRTSFEQTLKKMGSKGGAVLDDVLYQLRRFWAIEGKTIATYARDCIGGVTEEFLGKKVKFGLKIDFETLQESARPLEVTMTLGQIMNKFVDSQMLPTYIDDARAPSGYEPKLPEPVRQTKPSPLTRTIVKLACKHIAENTKKSKEEQQDPEEWKYCDQLYGAKRPNRPRIACDVLAEKASENFENIMAFVGMKGIDPNTGDFFEDDVGTVFPADNSAGRKKRLNGTWQAYAYCVKDEFNEEEDGQDCKRRVPLLETIPNTGVWRLPDWSRVKLLEEVTFDDKLISIFPDIDPQPVKFESRIADREEYKKLFLNNVGVTPAYHDLHFNDLNPDESLKPYYQFMPGKGNLHHVISDNLWKKDGMLRALMYRKDCNRHMDMKYNLLELASSESMKLQGFC
jgi:hypothetical protein